MYEKLKSSVFKADERIAKYSKKYTLGKLGLISLAGQRRKTLATVQELVMSLLNHRLR